MTRDKALALASRRSKERGGPMRCWKSRLSSDWANGRDAEQLDGAYLRQIRNTCGPAWLMDFRMPN